MNLSYHFIILFIFLSSISIKPHASSKYNSGSSRLIKGPLPLFRETLVSTMELAQNVASTMSQINVDSVDVINPDSAFSYCADLLGETATVLNWTLHAINQKYSQGYKQSYTTNDAISHARTLLNGSLGRQETCTGVIEGTKYHSTVAGSHKQMITYIHKILNMLRKPEGRSIFRPALLGWSGPNQCKILQQPNAIVSQDGSGNFRRIMDAVAAAPSHSPNHYVILVKKGVYYEYVNIDDTKSNLVMIGEGMDATTITGSRSAGTGQPTFDSGTFVVRAQGFVAMNIGFENTAGPENGQAVALQTSGDNSAFYRCKMSGNQDTLLVQSGRQFFRECTISGTVDFIFGYGSAVFQRCNIYIKKNPIGGTSVIAASNQLSPTDSSAFTFQFCNIDGDSDLKSIEGSSQQGGYLGRNWGVYARTVFLQSYMSSVIRPAGWLQRGDSSVDHVYFGEFDNNGPGSELANRVKWPGYRIMSLLEAEGFTVAQLLGGNAWLKALGIPHTKGMGKL